MPEVKEVIDKLLDRTNQNKIGWESTVTKDTFIAVIGSLGVSIALPGRGPSLDPVVRFRIMDKAGKVLQELNADQIDDPAIYSKLRQLHQQARQSAQGNTASWDELLAELERV